MDGLRLKPKSDKKIYLYSATVSFCKTIICYLNAHQTECFLVYLCNVLEEYLWLLNISGSFQPRTYEAYSKIGASGMESSDGM